MVSPLIVARANQYLPAVKSAAAAYGVPWWILAAIVAVESGYSPTALRTEPQLGKDSFGNTVASYGLAQILPDTARSAGVTLTSAQQLYDVTTNLRAAAAYIARLHGKGDGTWNGVISLYNGGSGTPATKVTRFCLEWKKTAPTSGRTLDRDCANIYTAKIGEYLNQPYVDQVTGYVKAFQALDLTTTAVNDATDAVANSPGISAGVLVLLGLGLYAWKGNHS